MPHVPPPEPAVGPRLRFGRFVLDERRGVIAHEDGQETTLRPKTFELLLLLLRNPGRLVSRAEILDSIWPGVFVTDDSITQCVVEIRRALGDDGSEMLRTLPRRGYILEAEVAPADAPLDRGQPSLPAAPRAGPGVSVVAVLPFRRVEPDARLGAVSEGIVDGIVGTLAALREPIVISSSSTRHLLDTPTDLAEIGRRLRADYVTSGSVRNIGARVRLAVELAEAASGLVRWHRTYDLVEATMFEAQDDIAATIANTLAPRVQEADLQRSRLRPDDISAYFLMLRARHLMFRLERRALDEAGVLIRQAITLDPTYAPAHAALAGWYHLRIGQGWSSDVAADAEALEAALRKAIEHDFRNARALALLGHTQTIIRRDYEEALYLLDRALDAAPNDAEAWLWSSPTYAWMGDAAEAIRRAERAMALSPEDPFIFRYEHFRAIAHYTAREYEAALHWGLRSCRANPHYTSNLRLTAAATAALGQMEDARRIAQQVMRLEPEFRVGRLIERHAYRDPAARALYGRHLTEAGLPP
ncbi:MAG TPA: winged helix-turn-helix domain-containing protein [Acetobacteraceae bacterium]|nr:winged helix-turn-helix domain-containing protein [Acetobacteraceae bacterium]